jgi:predicted XRE-type DNA-binding protein
MNKEYTSNQIVDDTPLTVSNHSTKGELSKSLKQVFTKNNIKQNDMDELLTALHQHDRNN